jgi:hypothetical protein
MPRGLRSRVRRLVTTRKTSMVAGKADLHTREGGWCRQNSAERCTRTPMLGYTSHSWMGAAENH